MVLRGRDCESAKHEAIRTFMGNKASKRPACLHADAYVFGNLTSTPRRTIVRIGVTRKRLRECEARSNPYFYGEQSKQETRMLACGCLCIWRYMILSVNNLSKSYDGNDILNNISFHIEANDKLGVTGINGAGKTTLIRQIIGEETPDTGSVTLAKGARMGYLSQTALDNSDRTIYEEVLSVKQYLIDMEEELRDLEHRMNEVSSVINAAANPSADGRHDDAHFSADGSRSDAAGSKEGAAASWSEIISFNKEPHAPVSSEQTSANPHANADLSDSGLNRAEQVNSDGNSALEDIYSRYANLSHRFELENGYAVRSNVTGILKGLGFSEEDYGKKVSMLSGGQKTRLALGRLLMDAPEILVLDEPTNHLDIASVSWLEGYLKSWRGAVIIVSHDRYFLDRIVNKILDIENGTAHLYLGNYTAFAEKKAALRKDMMKAYLNNQAALKHQQEVIDKLKQFNREKSIKRAESREKALAKMERIDKPFDVEDAMKLHFTPSKLSGKDVLFADGLSKSFGSLQLFSGVNLDIKRGEKLAIIGPNGTGKTTLLKIIMGLEPADKGELDFGSLVEPAYYDQEHQVLDPDNTVFDEISDAYPYMNNTQIRNLLASFLFTGDDVFKLIRDLSGGEKGRVSLAKLMLSKANLLLLDEPTNHLDITSKEILEEALRNYEGTVICVSHDRYFINRIATRILELDHHHFINYQGNYDYYLEKQADATFDKLKAISGQASEETAGSAGTGLGKAGDRGAASEASQGTYNTANAATGAATAAATGAAPAAASTGVTASESGSPSVKLSYQEQKQRRQQVQKLRNALNDCEKRIAEHEELISNIDAEIAIPANAVNSAKLNELTTKQARLQEELSELYSKWEELSEQIEAFDI